MAELKSCPFCGSKPKMVSHPIAQRQSQYAVQCQCGARFRFVDRRYKAVDLWNTRIPKERGGEK